RWVHELRAESSAILTTAETAIRDGSRLTVRDADIPDKPPVRLILDRKLRLPLDHPMLEPTQQGGLVWIITRPGQSATEKARQLVDRHAQIIEIADTGMGLDLPALMDYLG